MKKMNTRMLVTAAILIALNVILSRFLSINTLSLKIGFTFVTVFMAGYLYGPVMGAGISAMGDVLGAILFPIAPFFPGFTLTAALNGALHGIMLHKKQSRLRVAVTVGVEQLVLSMWLNTYWIHVLNGTPFWPLLATRVVQCLIMIPVEYILINILLGMLGKIKHQIV